MLVLLAACLSVLLLPTASAGGVYCAKAARARAAAMGLGHPEAADPLGLTHHGRFPSNYIPRGPVHYEHNYGLGEADTELVKGYQGKNYQRAGYPNPWTHGQIPLRGFVTKPAALNHHGYDPAWSEPLLSKSVYFPRELVVSRLQPSFEPEKNFASPANVEETPVKLEIHRNGFQGQYKLGSVVYFFRKPVVDVSVPRQHDGLVWRWFPQHKSRNHKKYRVPHYGPVVHGKGPAGRFAEAREMISQGSEATWT